MFAFSHNFCPGLSEKQKKKERYKTKHLLQKKFVAI